MKNNELVKLIIKGVIGMIIGMVFAFSTLTNHFAPALAMGFFFAGLPYGWQLSGKVIGGWVIGSIPAMVIAFAIRLIISILIGWIAYPIALICAIIKTIRRKGERIS